MEMKLKVFPVWKTNKWKLFLGLSASSFFDAALAILQAMTKSHQSKYPLERGQTRESPGKEHKGINDAHISHFSNKIRRRFAAKGNNSIIWVKTKWFCDCCCTSKCRSNMYRRLNVPTYHVGYKGMDACVLAAKKKTHCPSLPSKDFI